MNTAEEKPTETTGTDDEKDVEAPSIVAALRARSSSATEIGELRGANLAGQDLSGLDLSGLDFSGADFSGADLSDANLGMSKLLGANFHKANLDRCELLAADLSRANLNECSAVHAGLGAANLTHASLIGAKLHGATLSKSTLCETDFRAADLQGARLNEADLSRAVLTRANLKNADLKNSCVFKASLALTDLRGARLMGIKQFYKANWVGADIRDVDLRGAYTIRRFIEDENYLYEFRTKSKYHAFLYKLWWLTSDCGRSIARWGLWLLAVTVLFALLYTVVGVDFGEKQTWFSPLYFSIVTLTTLGYGDVLPASATAQFLAATEALFGYVGLGGLLSIMSNKMARRAD